MSEKPAVLYARVWIAHREDDDRFYLVSDDLEIALPTPPELHGHLSELIAASDDRLGCHAGFVPWSDDRVMEEP